MFMIIGGGTFGRLLSHEGSALVNGLTHSWINGLPWSGFVISASSGMLALSCPVMPSTMLSCGKRALTKCQHLCIGPASLQNLEPNKLLFFINCLVSDILS
jgi:hypothetical protein